MNNKTILVNALAIVFFRTALNTINNFHINLYYSYFLTDQRSHFLNKKFFLVLKKDINLITSFNITISPL